MARHPELRDAPVLKYELRNVRPIQLSDLTLSLNAFEAQYQRFILERGVVRADENVRLYVADVRAGSIIAELASVADQISFVVDHREELAAFATHLNEIFEFFLNFGRRQTKLPRKDLEQISQIVEPIAKDAGSQLNLSINSNGGDVKVTINSIGANALQNAIARSITKLPETSDKRFRQEVLTLYQARNDPRGKTGDKGKIEKFSHRHLKLIFENEQAKRAVLDQSGNIFQLAYVVDGEVMTVDGEAVAYKINYVHEVFKSGTARVGPQKRLRKVKRKTWEGEGW